MKKYVFIVCACLILASKATAQTSLNPDISVVGDLRVFSHNDHSRNSEVREINLTNPGMELNLNGFVNPYTYAVAIIGFEEGEPANIEEMYLKVNRGLPLGLSARIGKNLLEFGRLNPVHQHAWSFLKRPLPHSILFAEEGLNDITVQVSRLLPTGDAYTELVAGVVQGEALLASNEGVELIEKPDIGYFGRLTSSFAVSESAELALGLSAFNAVSLMDSVGMIDATSSLRLNQFRSWIIGIDLKLKDHPSQYKALQLEGELLLRSDDTPIGRMTSIGAYGFLDYRFQKRYNLGVITEYAKRKEVVAESPLPIEMSSVIWRSGVFVGFSPVEETSIIRIAGHFTQPEDTKGFWEVTAQLVFSLGPHKPHNF